MSKMETIGEIGGSVQDNDAIATALFFIWAFFMFGWLVDPAISPLPPSQGATASNFSLVSAFFPLLIVIIPVALFGILKNMFESETVTRQAFKITPQMLIGLQTGIAKFTASTQAKRQYYKKYGRATRYRKPKPTKQEEESE